MRGSDHGGGRSAQPSMIQAAVLLGGLACLIMLFAGCTTQTVGMQAPLAHDYDGMEWRPLDSVVVQPVVVAPGYTALVENDPGTDTGELLARINSLPADIRAAELVEIRLALRPAEDLEAFSDLHVAFQAADGERSVLALGAGDLIVEHDWVIFTGLPDLDAGDVVEVQLDPSSGWEYGVTVDRLPYGGLPASVASEGAALQEISGSLGFETVFDQETDTSEMVSERVGPAIGNAITDRFLAPLYAMIVAAFGVFVVIRRRLVQIG